MKKLLEFDKRYSSLILCFSLLFIILFLVYTRTINNKSNTCTIPNSLVKNYTNYSYNIIVTNNEKKIELSIKRHDYKYLIEKKEDNIRSTYYLYYTDFLEKSSSGDYIKYRGNYIVDNLDNKYLILDYINELSLKSSVSTIEGKTCYTYRPKSLIMCINLDDSISFDIGDYNLTYTVKDIGNIDDFDIDYDISNEDDNNNSNEVTDESYETIS